ncbi:MAG: hypothetical protein E7632_02715 [Ruminococcaceae bacterium]|nr:hypothetical protein [Oscillospiraceae bacterium]
MNYKRLLLSTGGGIISENQMDEQANCATIAIGLGGTGIACLRNFKSQIYSHVRPDNDNTIVPKYSHIKFLAVDSDATSLNNDGDINGQLDPNDEFFPISCDDINGLISNSARIANSPECKWLQTLDPEKGKQGLSIFSTTAGAGGVRQIGRLLLLQKSDLFVQRVEQMIDAATANLTGGYSIVVHIFTGIGGGTGSGTFLDVCYLVRHALERKTVLGKAALLGYFFLPDVNLSRPNLPDPTRRYIMENGFSAMKELDYCMSFAENHGEWNQTYRGFSLDHVKDSPVKIAHLISANTIKGVHIDGSSAFDYAMNVVSDYAMMFLVKNNASFDINSHIGNYFANVAKIQKPSGANYHYCLLGAAKAVVPIREITTYLGSALFERMSYLKTRQPDDLETEAIAKELGLTGDLILAALKQGSQQIGMSPELFNPNDYKHIAITAEVEEEDNTAPAELLAPLRKGREKLLGKVRENGAAMTNDWSVKMLNGDQGETSKVCAVYNKLKSIVVDSATGPIYAALVLNGAGNKNLINMLQGTIREYDVKLDHLRSDMELRYKAVYGAKRALADSNMFNRKTNFANYVGALVRYFRDATDITIIEEARKVTVKIIDQLKELYTHFYVYSGVVENLIDTFNENKRYLDSVENGAITDPFVQQLIKLEDVRDSIAATIEGMDLAGEMSSFNDELFRDFECWINGDERKIAKKVSEYLLARFSGYTNKTLTDYLEIKFQTNDPTILTQRVQNEILEPLSSMADPMFWMGSLISSSVVQPVGYAWVPNSAAVIQNAMTNLVGTATHKHYQINSCDISDRVSLVLCSCGMPMFGYAGIANYKNEYDNAVSVGRHLYEGTDADPRDWRTLSDLLPYSTQSYPTEIMKQRSAAYDRAIELGIIINAPGTADWRAAFWPDITADLDAAKAAIATGDVNTINSAKAAFEAKMASIAPERFTLLVNDGAMGHEEAVRRDHVVNSAALSANLAKEIAVRESVPAMIAALDEAVKSISIGFNLKADFNNAMMTGVFDYKHPKITYEYKNEFGVPTVITLSEPAMTPYGAVCPIYQAYKTFAALDEAKRTYAGNLANERLALADEQMKASCEQLSRIFNDNYLRAVGGLLESRIADSDERMEIQKFVYQFRQLLADTSATYFLS